MSDSAKTRGPAWVHLLLPYLLVPLAAQQPMADLVHSFAPHDVDSDGLPEVVRLELLGEAGAEASPAVVVFVEERLLSQRVGVPTEAIAGLRGRLLRYAADLAAQGYRASVVAVAVHTGPPHQDGRTVLGLRRFLRACRDRRPLAGALLVGHFPDALLVRTCNWRRNEALELPARDGAMVKIEPATTNVRSVPEYVAHRCDIVLADLDGEWESVYVPGPTALPSVTAVFGDNVPADGGPCVGIREGVLHVIDVFHTADGRATVDRAVFSVAIDDADRDHECAPADRQLGNPIAQAEIAVSRIDARGVALVPHARCLDGSGQPQTVTLGEGEQAKSFEGWTADAALELRLLSEYFDRNHAFRTTPLPAAANKPASIAWGLGSGMHMLRGAAPEWREFAADGYDVTANADLRALFDWLRRPAVLRTLRAHSDPFAAAFHATDVPALEQAIGGPAWAWRVDGRKLVPSLAACAGGRADFAFYRTLWQNHAVPDQAYLLVHTGCEALSPPGSCELPFDDPSYGHRAHAESMLFFTPCLAIVGRAKVFYDEPRGFCEALAAGATFGDAWRRYFAIEGAAANWDEAGGDIGRKRAYLWSVLGDWTLRLPRPQ